MSLRDWALKPGELRPLTRGGRLLLAARCAIRVEPWRPPGVDALWDELLAVVVAAAFDRPPPKTAATRARTVADAGAAACHRLDATDEPLGRNHNYATSTLATAVAAAAQADGPALTRAILDVAKLSASIPAMWAHAGRVRARGNPVDVAATATWNAIRRDVTTLATRLPALERAPDRLAALRRLPLWIGRAPAWSSP